MVKMMRGYSTNRALTADSPVQERKIIRLLKLIQMLCKDKWNSREISDELDVNPRTALRYIQLLNEMDISIDVDFKGKYFIINGCCPICGK